MHLLPPTSKYLLQMLSFRSLSQTQIPPPGESCRSDVRGPHSVRRAPLPSDPGGREASTPAWGGIGVRRLLGGQGVPHSDSKGGTELERSEVYASFGAPTGRRRAWPRRPWLPGHSFRSGGPVGWAPGSFEWLGSPLGSKARAPVRPRKAILHFSSDLADCEPFGSGHLLFGLLPGSRNHQNALGPCGAGAP